MQVDDTLSLRTLMTIFLHASFILRVFPNREARRVVTIMALRGLYRTRYKDFGDKNLEGFREAWKEVVRKIGNLLKIDTLAQELMRHLSCSYILKDEIGAYRREAPDAEDWQ